jgi:hypothetical protein
MAGTQGDRPAGGPAERGDSRPAPAGGRLALLAFVALSLLLYWLLWVPAYRLNERFEYADLLFSAWPAIAHLLAVQLAVLQALAPATVASHAGTVALLLGLLAGLGGLYLGALWLSARLPRRFVIVTLLAATAAFQLVLLPLPGTFTTDLFSYAFYGEVAGRLGASPYVRVPEDYPAHPLYLLIDPLWRDAPSVYGPVWVALSSVVGATLGGQILPQVLAYRLIANLSHWANLALLWWALARLRPGHEPLGLALYALNPLVLFELVANGHNDGTMIMFMLLAFGLIARGRVWPGVAALQLAAATKYTALLLLPAVLWWGTRGQQGWRRLAAVAVGGIAAMALLLALYLPWWQGPATLGPIVRWLSTPLYTNHAPLALAFWLRDQLVAWGGLSFEEAELLALDLQRLALRLLFLLYLALETFRLRRVEDLPAAGARVLLVFLLAVNTWVLPWYFTWPLALAALGRPGSRTTLLALSFSASALLSMYWAQTSLEGMPLAGYVLYLAPLAGLGLWPIAQHLAGWLPAGIGETGRAWAADAHGWERTRRSGG